VIVADKRDIGAAFKALREKVGLAPKDLVLRGHDEGLSYSDISKLESGHSALLSARKRQALAVAFQVSTEIIDKLASLEITPAAAAKAIAKEADLPKWKERRQHLAANPPKLAPPKPKAVAQNGTHPVPSRDSSKWATGEGHRLAALTRLVHLKDARFPNLELCLLYHGENGRNWPEQAVETARSGYGTHGDRDLPTPSHWQQVLDRLEAALKIADPRNAPEETPRNAGPE